MHKLTLAVLALLFATSAAAQNPLRHFTESIDARFARSQPVIQYALTVSDTDTTGFDVQMWIRNAPDTFRIAMAKHPEYDDRFFRFVQNLRVFDRGAAIVREDSAVWRVTAPGGAVSIAYRIALPASPSSRAAWRPFLTSRGALTGGPQTFMYVVGAELAPAYVSVVLPNASTWAITTGLTPTSESRTFFAPSAYVLMESPILMGYVRTWEFPVAGVPHTIAYWRSPTGVPFDTAIFRRGIEIMVNEAVSLFGRPPYREYIFQFQDNAYGALEHYNSVTLGAPSAELARNPNSALSETAHEFFHTWNLVRIRPAEYVGVTYRTIQPVPTLWFSEGLTMYYADLLLRRAKLPTSDSTRVTHLQNLITRYFAQPGNTRFSPEQVSRVSYGTRPDALGDYEGSTHLQGELLGGMLDIVIRDATNGRRSMDDVMRLMLERFGGQRGFTGVDIERTMSNVCGCTLKSFIDTYVRSAHAIDFNRHLALIGLRAEVDSQPAARDGQPLPDSRIRAWMQPWDSTLALLINNPRSVWGRAGLHSGDRVLSVDGVPVSTPQDFRQIIGRLRIGDTLRLSVQSPRANAPRDVTVAVTGYVRPVVRISELSAVTEKQRRMREAWLLGAP
jgi:predicted metalloprotease with PDZ domain